MAAAGEEKKALQKSYSFDNVSFSQVDLHEVDIKYIGAIQKAMTTLSAELANDMAVFTADDMAKTVKQAGPRSLIQSGAMDTLKKLLADPATKQNAHTVIASLATTCNTLAEVCAHITAPLLFAVPLFRKVSCTISRAHMCQTRLVHSNSCLPGD